MASLHLFGEFQHEVCQIIQETLGHGRLQTSVVVADGHDRGAFPAIHADKSIINSYLVGEASM
jgi:flagellar biosynthesis/type III secretory pathway ATPase